MAESNLVSLKNKSEKSQYTIVGSQHIRFNSTYHVAVSVHNATAPCTIRLTIENGGDFKQSKEVVVQPLSTESVAFAFGVLPKPARGIYYKLIAEGVQGIEFRSETRLHVIAKEFGFLVQTDKALYKPGDLMRFRVLVIDENTKPVELNEELEVHIEDGAANRIKQWSKLSTPNGVYSGEFRLSDNPVLGKWTFAFEARGEKKSHSVEVAKYVLPTFEVHIETADNVLYANRKIHANIRGKYPFGKPVHGEAVVTLRSEPMLDDELSKASRVIQVTAKGSVEFDLVDDLHLLPESVQSLQMHVTLEEELTGRKQTATAMINVRRSKYSIMRNSFHHNYMEGKPLELDVLLARYDSVPVPNPELEVWYSSDLSLQEELHSGRHTGDKEGQVKILLNLPLEKLGFFVMAKYEGITEFLGYFPSTVYRKERFSDFSVNPQQHHINDISIGQSIIIELQSHKPLHFYTYQLIARGDVLLTKTVKVENPTQQKYELKFDVTFEMLPNVQLVAYTVRDDGTVDVANTYISLQTTLPNPITLEPSVSELQPGQNAEVRVATSPKSFVGLMAVDQRILQMRDGNDLNENDVTQSLMEFGSLYSRPAFGEYAQESRYQWNSKMYTFESQGCFVLSNLKELIPKPLEEIAHFCGSTATFGGKLEKGNLYAADAYRNQQDYAADLNAIRSNFADTWIWDTATVESADGSHTIQAKVPDTITSWVLTAFSLSPDVGIGLTQKSSKLTVVKPFFVSLTLPYSVKRGELISIPVIVFNYLGAAVTADVTLFNADQEFEFVELIDDVEVPNTGEKTVKSVSIKSNDGTGVQFLIKPLKVGSLTIKVTAVSPLAGDGIQQILPVTPEGAQQYVNKAMLVDLRDRPSLETKFTIEVPSDAVPDSTTIEVSAIADVMGPTTRNLEKLISMPSGSGEHNMMHFVPNIVIRHHLKSIGQLSDEVELKTRLNMEIGYQRQLTYRHHDGSFSAFGTKDAGGSTWLTAFVTRAFGQAAAHIRIEARMIETALAFLSGVQAEDGSFPEVGDVIYRRMQSGAASGVALTAYTLLAFVENQHSHPEHTEVIAKACEYLVKNLDTLSDVYAIAVAAYALQLANHPAKAELLRNLNAVAIVDGDRKHWGKPETKPQIDPRQPVPLGFFPLASSGNVEITGYVLLAHFHAGLHEEAVPIMRWLLSQRNAHGGFASTQDTVVGLPALAAIAGRMGFEDNNDVKLELVYGDGQSSAIEVNHDNAMVLQQVQLPGSVRDVQVTASGKGVSLLSLTYSYYVNETGAEPRFKIEPKVAEDTPLNALRFEVSTSFIPTEEATVSNMAVMEVEFPTGYTFDVDTYDALAATEGVKRVELKNGDTLVVLHFNSLGAEPVCLKFEAVRTHKVDHLKPAAITVYDYYDQARKSRVFYKKNEE